jgi:hypothetical protein
MDIDYPNLPRLYRFSPIYKSYRKWIDPHPIAFVNTYRYSGIITNLSHKANERDLCTATPKACEID